jgi:hypothetical protein
MSDDYTKLLTALNKDVFVWSFKTYKNIVAAYKTSKSNNENTESKPAEPNADANAKAKPADADTVQNSGQ